MATKAKEFEIAIVSENVAWQDEFENPRSVIEYSYYYTTIANIITSGFFIDQFGSLRSSYMKVPYTRGVPSDTDRQVAYTNMAGMSVQTTIKPQRGGDTTIFIPVNNAYRLILGGGIFVSSPLAGPTFMTNELPPLFDIFEKDFSKSFWDIDTACAMTIPVNEASLNLPGVTLDMIDADSDFVEWMLSQLKSIRVVSPAAGSNQRNRKVRTLADAPQDEDGQVSYKRDVLGVRTYSLFCEVLLPADYVRYITQSTSPTRVNLHQYLTVAFKEAADTGKVPWVFNPLQNVKMQNTGKKVIGARVNQYGLAIDRSGAPLYIPQVDNITSYDAQYDSLGNNDDTMGWSLANPMSAYTTKDSSPAAQIDNRIIYYDGVNNKLTYSHESAVAVKDLNDCIAADDHHVYAILTTPLSSSNTLMASLKALDTFLRKLPDLVNKVQIDLNDFTALKGDQTLDGRQIYDFAGYGSWVGNTADDSFKAAIGNLLSSGISNYYAEADNMINSLHRYYNSRASHDDNYEVPQAAMWYYSNANTEVTLRDLSANSDVGILRPLGALIQLLSKALLQQPMEWMQQAAISTGMTALGMAVVFDHYIPNITSVEANTQSYLEKISPIRPTPDWKSPAIPGISPNYSLLPHQGSIQQKLARNPQLVILSADAGAGKCAVGSTLVSTNRGLLTLKEIWDSGIEFSRNSIEGWNTIDIGVNTLEGRAKATRAYRRKGETLKSTFSNGWEWEGLPEHKFWAYDATLNKLCYRQMGDIEVGSWLPRVKATTYYFPKTEPELPELANIKLMYYKTDKSWVENAKIPTHMTPDLAELLGWLVSEGCPTKYNIEQHDADFLNHINKLSKRVFGSPFADKVFDTGDTTIYYGRYKEVFKRLLSEKTLYSNQMHIPKCIRTATKFSQQRFLQACWQGDGSIYRKTDGGTIGTSKNRWELEYGTVSDKLAQQMVHVLDSFGIKATCQITRSYVSKLGTKDERNIWKLFIDDYYIEQFAEQIGFLGEEKKEALAICVGHKRLVRESGRFQTSNHESMGEMNRLPKEPYWIMFDNFWEAIESRYPSHIIVEHSGKQQLRRPNNPWTVAERSAGRHMKTSRVGREHEHMTRLTVEKWMEIFEHLPESDKNLAFGNKKFANTFNMLKDMLTKFDGWVYLAHKAKGKVRTVYDLTVPKGSNYVATGMHQHNTGQALYKISEMLKDGVCKRPLIICPPYLVNNYFQDNVMMTNGKLNLIAITRSTFMAHGEDNIARMVMNAPPNTCFITDYFFVKGNTKEVAYGSTTVTYSQFSEYLKNFEFDAVFADECHILKNESSKLTQASTMLMQTIPMRYLMSGTFVDGNLGDIVSQVRILDPTIFGSTSDFNDTYAENYSGGKVYSWQPGAQKRMGDKIETRISYIQSKKREWSSLLPQRIEVFHPVELTKNQKDVYDAILTQVLEEIRNNPDIMKKLKEKDLDDDDAVGLEALLNPYLARLEQFLTSPSLDDAGKLLTGDDAISPKVEMILDIINDHISQKIPGKILIFTSYRASAASIYNALPAALQKRFVLYTAANKAADKARFLNDPNILGMVGVEKSLNTGNNFQIASRIIRGEVIWNPGELEQAESRIFRPDVKNKYGIKKKYLDWIVASKTIDVTKAARLMSKVLAKALFDERDNPLYDNLEQVPIISMNLDSIEADNDFLDTLSDHLNAYQSYRERQEEDFQKFREDPTTLKIPFAVPVAPDIKNSAYVIDAPYVDNMTIPFMDQLGLTELSTWAGNQNKGVNEFDATGLAVHTEFGDGIVSKSSKTTIRVKVGKRSIVTDKTKAFVFLDQNAAKASVGANPMKTATAIAKAIGLPTKNSGLVNDNGGKGGGTPVDSTTPVKAPSTDTVAPIKTVVVKPKPIVPPAPVVDQSDDEEEIQAPVPNTDKIKNGIFNVYAVGVNNQWCLALDPNDPDLPDADTLKSEGFVYTGQYYYAYINSRKAMNALKDYVDAMVKKGNISIPPSMYSELEYITNAYNSSKNLAHTLQSISSADLKLYKQTRMRKPTNPATVYLQFIVEADGIYAMITTSKATRGRKFVTKSLPGVKWHQEVGSWIAYYKNKPSMVNAAKALSKRYKIENLKDLQAQIKSLRIHAGATPADEE